MNTNDQDSLFSKFKVAREEFSNPFKLKDIVTATEVWGAVLTDIPTLHAEAEKTIYKYIRNIEEKSKVGILIYADAGVGKSHLIHRVRETLESKSLGIFAYIPPITEPERPDLHVRYHVVESLTQQNDAGISQWEIIAARLIATVKSKSYSKYVELSGDVSALKQFILTEHKFMTHFEMIEFLDSLSSEIAKSNKLKADYVKAVLLFLFENEKQSKFKDAKEGAMSWFQGSDDEEKISAAKLSKFSYDQQQTISVSVISQICLIAKAAKLPVVVCFDQLDNFVPSFDCQYTPAQVAANCVDRLYLQCENLVLITSAVTERMVEINQLPTATQSRVKEVNLPLNPPNADDMYSIIRQRLEWFYKKADLPIEDLPPFYPFDQAQVQYLVVNLEKERSNLRNLLNKCTEMFDQAGGTPPKNDLEKFIELYEQNLSELQKQKLSKNDDEIAEVIRFCLTNIHEECSGVIVSKVELVAKNNDVQMIVCGYDSIHLRDVRIGVRVCNTGTAATFNAIMNKVLDYNKYKLTRGCLVRTEAIKRTWTKGLSLKDELIKKNGEVVILKDNELLPLITLYQIFQQEPDKDKSMKLIDKSNKIAQNPLIQEILSAP